MRTVNYSLFTAFRREKQLAKEHWKQPKFNTASDLFSGHRFSGNDRFSGTKIPDDAILSTNSGITDIVEYF